MDVGQTDISCERNRPLTNRSLLSFDSSEYLNKFTAPTLKSNEPHIQELLSHLAQHGSGKECTYRDPVHGERTLPDWMLQIIDTPPLLRLSQVCQMTLLPHSRLAHSIGVAILAMDLAEINYLDEPHKRLLVTLGLLHDVRHGPYSHLFDNLYVDDKKDWFDHDARLHEFVSHPHLRKALADAQVDEHAVIEILKDPKKDQNGYIVKEILDRVDYAIRDADNSKGFFAEDDQLRICDAAMNLFCRVQYDRLSGSFYFPDAEGTHLAIEKFVGVRQYAFDRLAYDEDRRLTESLIYTAIKNMLVDSEDKASAGKLVVALSHLSDPDLEALLPESAAVVLRQAKQGATLGIVRIDGATLTPLFKELRGRANGGRGATNTIIDELRNFDPESNFLVAIVPQISPTMHFKVRSRDGDYYFITGRRSDSPGGVYDETKCIAISRYRTDGIPTCDTARFRACVQEMFITKAWIANPDVQLDSASFRFARRDGVEVRTIHQPEPAENWEMS